MHQGRLFKLQEAILFELGMIIINDKTLSSKYLIKLHTI